MKVVTKTRTGSYAVIIKDRKIALIKKARGGYKGKYDLPGGGIEHMETPLEALYRECREEIGANVIHTELLDVTSVNIKWLMKEELTEDLHHIGVLYKVEIAEDNLKKDADGLDSDGALWLDIDDLKEDNVSPFVWHCLKIMNYK